MATTHLERDPQSTDRLISRGYQYGLLFREMLAFAGAHNAEGGPVVFTGDVRAALSHTLSRPFSLVVFTGGVRAPSYTLSNTLFSLVVFTAAHSLSSLSQPLP